MRTSAMVVRGLIVAAVIATTALVVGLAPVSATPGAVERQYILGPPMRTVIERGPAGASPGDLTTSTGDLLDPSTRKRVGFYTTNQMTVRVDAAGGREIRDNAITFSLPGGEIIVRGLIRAPIDAPPTTSQRFAVLGGTGRFEGVWGTASHTRFTSEGATLTLHLHGR